MPDRNKHLNRARQTEALASSLNANLGAVVDRAIAMLFYAALHHVGAYLARGNMHPLSHEQRDREIESNALRRASIRLRCYSSTANSTHPGSVAGRLLRNTIRRVLGNGRLLASARL